MKTLVYSHDDDGKVEGILSEVDSFLVQDLSKVHLLKVHNVHVSDLCTIIQSCPYLRLVRLVSCWDLALMLLIKTSLDPNYSSKG